MPDGSYVGASRRDGVNQTHIMGRVNPSNDAAGAAGFADVTFPIASTAPFADSRPMGMSIAVISLSACRSRDHPEKRSSNHHRVRCPPDAARRHDAVDAGARSAHRDLWPCVRRCLTRTGSSAPDRTGYLHDLDVRSQIERFGCHGAVGPSRGLRTERRSGVSINTPHARRDALDVTVFQWTWITKR